MEIERKYLIPELPEEITSYPYHLIEQGYLSTEPVIRVRRENNTYYLTYKSKGFLEREEYNLPLTKDSYENLIKKSEGNILTKKRYFIPLKNSDSLVAELDVFEGRFQGLILAEVEFKTRKEAENFIPPDWFGRDVTFLSEYQNSSLSQLL